MSDPLTFYNPTVGGSLISLEVAKQQLRITDDTHDEEIERKAHEATDLVLSYLKHGTDPTWTVDTVPLPVAAAIQILLGHLYEDRGDKARETDADADHKVWESVYRMLDRFRDPTWS